MPAAMTQTERASKYLKDSDWHPGSVPYTVARDMLAAALQAERDAATAADIAVLEQMEAGLKVGKYPDLQAAAVVGQCIAAIRGGRQP